MLFARNHPNTLPLLTHYTLKFIHTYIPPNPHTHTVGDFTVAGNCCGSPTITSDCGLADASATAVVGSVACAASSMTSKGKVRCSRRGSPAPTHVAAITSQLPSINAVCVWGGGDVYSEGECGCAWRCVECVFRWNTCGCIHEEQVHIENIPSLPKYHPHL